MDGARDVAAGRGGGEPERAQHAGGARAEHARDAAARRASASACSGPAPPKGISAKPRGSMPRSTVISRSAPSISASATRTMPSAQASGSRPSSAARRPTARSAADAVERHAAGQRRVVEQAAEQQVGVGDGRRPAVSCRGARSRPVPGRRRRTAGPTRRAPPGSRQAIEPPPAPTVWMSSAGAPAAARRSCVRRSRRTCRALDHAHVAGGAAHVEAQHVCSLGQFGQQQRAADAAGGPGEDGERGVGAGSPDVGEPAGGLHDLRLGQRRARRASLGQAGEVGAEQRRQRGVEHGGGGALVLAEGAHQVAGERHVDAGQPLGQQRAEQQLVRGVGVGVKQRHGHRLRLGLAQRGRRASRARPGHRAPAAGRPALMRSARGEAQLARHQRRGGGARRARTGGRGLAGELDHVGEARRGDQRGARHRSLQQRVGGDGHAVGEALDLLRRGAGAREHQLDRREHAARLLGGRGGDLGGVDGAVGGRAAPRR